jgi:hypothetical protein
MYEMDIFVKIMIWLVNFFLFRNFSETNLASYDYMNKSSNNWTQLVSIW